MYKRQVHQVLTELGVEPDRIVGVLNKIDAQDDQTILAEIRSVFQEAVVVSARTGVGLERLADAVVARRSTDWAELDLLVPHSQARLTALAHEHGQVLTEDWTDSGWRARVSIPQAIRWQLEPFLVDAEE